MPQGSSAATLCHMGDKDDVTSCELQALTHESFLSTVLHGWLQSTSTVSPDLCPSEGVTGPRTGRERKRHHSVRVMIQSRVSEGLCHQQPRRSQGLSRRPAARDGRASRRASQQGGPGGGAHDPGSTEQWSWLDFRYAPVVGPSGSPPFLPGPRVCARSWQRRAQGHLA